MADEKYMDALVCGLKSKGYYFEAKELGNGLLKMTIQYPKGICSKPLTEFIVHVDDPNAIMIRDIMIKCAAIKADMEVK